VSWLIIQFIARGQEQPPSSQFEVVVLAFSACTFITYLLCWSKPQEVRTTRSISACRPPTVKDIIQLADQGPLTLGSRRTRHWMPNHALHQCREGLNPGRIVWLSSGIGAILFGSLHFIAWNFSFPTSVERLLWKVASIVSVSMPPVIMIKRGIVSLLVARPLVKNGHLYLGDTIQVRSTAALTGIYVLARVYITVEAFRTLGFLPPDAYRTTWSSSVPHVA
jgi:hypothetical protein